MTDDKVLVEKLRTDGQGWSFVAAEHIEEQAAEKKQLNGIIQGLESKLEFIISAIHRRVDTHSKFIESCVDHDIHPSPALFSTVAELRSLLREIERHD